MATPDNGLAAVLYSAATVHTKVGKGTPVRIKSTTNYPFDETLRFVMRLEETDTFPLYFRVPAWAEGASLAVNDNKISVKPEAGKYVKINREWSDGDTVVLHLPKKLAIKKWEKNHNSVSVYFGPLTFSLKIKEHYIKQDSDETAIGDSKWQADADTDKWPSYGIKAASPWNYGLMLDSDLDASFEIATRPWPKDNFPFTPTAVPLVLKAKAKKIPDWKIDKHGLVGELLNGPIPSSEPTEEVELIPMGAARLRISAFPLIGH